MTNTIFDINVEPETLISKDEYNLLTRGLDKKLYLGVPSLSDIFVKKTGDVMTGALYIDYQGAAQLSLRVEHNALRQINYSIFANNQDTLHEFYGDPDYNDVGVVWQVRNARMAFCSSGLLTVPEIKVERGVNTDFISANQLTVHGDIREHGQLLSHKYAPFTHSHSASEITAGVLAVSRIPDLDMSKIVTGALPWSRISDAPVIPTVPGWGGAGGALSSGGTGQGGSAQTMSRSDHTHTLPAYPTSLPPTQHSFLGGSHSGAADAAAARATLELGSAATQNSVNQRVMLSTNTGTANSVTGVLLPVEGILGSQNGGLGMPLFADPNSVRAVYFGANHTGATFGTLPLRAGGTGVSLDSAPSMLTNLGTSTAASPFAASPRPGCTGRLRFQNIVQGNGVLGRNSAGDGDLAYLAPAAANRILRSTAAGAYQWGSLQTDDVPNGAITNIKLRQSASLSVIGNPINGVNAPQDIVAPSDHQVLRRIGGSLGFGTVNLASPNAVTGVLRSPSTFHHVNTGVEVSGTVISAIPNAFTYIYLPSPQGVILLPGNAADGTFILISQDSGVNRNVATSSGDIVDRTDGQHGLVLRPGRTAGFFKVNSISWFRIF